MDTAAAAKKAAINRHDFVAWSSPVVLRKCFVFNASRAESCRIVGSGGNPNSHEFRTTIGLHRPTLEQRTLCRSGGQG